MSIVDRAKNILLTPKTEWPTIAAEPSSAQSLYTGYAAILALLPLAGTVLAGLLGLGAMGYAYGGFSSSLIGYAVLSYVIQLGLLYLIGLLAGVLAPSFDGKNDLVQGLKLIIYSSTPTWVVGLISPLLPIMLGGLLGLLALAYGIYILYLGAAPVMSVPAAKAPGYTAVVVVIWLIVALFVTGLIMTAIMGAIFGSMLAGGSLG